MKAAGLPITTPIRAWLIAGMLLLAAGCAGPALQYQSLESSPSAPRQAELTDTPFYPQAAYQCGPAALATLLQSSGVEKADPDTLADQVYLPQRRGSLQTELLGATRRADRIPYRLAPKLDDLLNEIRAGHPVLVLQNLRLPRWPQWHYAVVIGFDLDAGDVILRSGEDHRKVMSLHRFERTWQLGEYWAVVIPKPGQLPATASDTDYLQAVAALEQQNRWDTAITGYKAARERWPDNPTSHLGLGNIAYQQGKFPTAQRHYQAAIEVAPEAPVAHYNLAWALLRQGKYKEARLTAERTEKLAPDHPRYGRAVETIARALDEVTADRKPEPGS